VHYDYHDPYQNDNSSVGGNSISSGRGGGFNNNYSRGGGRVQKWNNHRDARRNDGTPSVYSEDRGRGGRHQHGGGRGTGKFNGGRHVSENEYRNEGRGGGRNYNSRGGGRGSRTVSSNASASRDNYSHDFGDGTNQTYSPHGSTTTGGGRATTTTTAGRTGRNYSNAGRKGGRQSNRGEGGPYPQPLNSEDNFHRGPRNHHGEVSSSSNGSLGRFGGQRGRGTGRNSSNRTPMRFEIGAPNQTNSGM
jgi:hypothetical protein